MPSTSLRIIDVDETLAQKNNDFKKIGSLKIKQGEDKGIAQWLAYMLTDPAAPGLVPSVLEIFSEEEIDNVVNDPA